LEKSALLKGIRVLDLGIFGVGPLACSFLGNMGADVIRVERPSLDNTYYLVPQRQGASVIYIMIQSDKQNIILDLKTDKGNEIVLRLVEKADIVIHNYQPEVMQRLGLDYDSVRKINPKVIYVSSSGYGHKGPLAKTPSFDHYQQAMSGFASINGSPGSQGESLRQLMHIDVSCAMGVCGSALMALFAREVTGKGQKIETSQFEIALSVQATRIAEYFATGVSPKPMGSANPNIVPSQAFKTLDGSYINVSIPREEYWPKLCGALGLDEIEKDPRFISNTERVRNREQLIPILEEKFASEPARWWLTLLRRHDVPCGPSYTFESFVTDPHIVANQMLPVIDTPWGEVMHTPFPVKFSKTDTTLNPAVKPDSSRQEILNDIGYKEKK
jgi:crotonobetainyl-CoA:carnitine CoA-transferase CaiB-like acyl-CoA transferase